MKKIRYIFEAIILYTLFTIFQSLPPKVASNLGGWIGRTFGSKLAASRKARRHIIMALPETTKQQQDKIIYGMWDNLGRVIAEYPHLERIGKEYTTLTNKEYILSNIKDNRPVIFISAHIANWEVNCATTLTQLDHALNLTYRAPNNKYVEKLLGKARTMGGKVKAYPKARNSGRHLINALKNKESLGILIDQKYNEGIEADFFSLPAMTNPVFVQLAQKYNCIISPVRCERISECNFKITAYPNIELFNKKGQKRSTQDIIDESHKILEEWIKDKPEQWIWLHKRWKD